jgi:hypothetical protein
MINMGKRSVITIILLMAELGLASNFLNPTGLSGNTILLGELHDSANNTNNCICSNNTCPSDPKSVVNKIDNSSYIGSINERFTEECVCNNNTTCSHNDCSFKNCTCINSEANCSSSMSRDRNEPCPVNVTPNQKELNNEKKGRIFTITLNCPRCT